jgi:thiol-disulfide isomerase/thioredoxin
MRRFAALLVALLVLAAAPQGAAAQTQTELWTAERFGAEFGKTYAIADALALCRRVAESSEDPALQRVVLERWKGVDPADAEAFFAARQEQQPRSPLAAVLRGLASQEPLDALRWARQAIEIDPAHLGAYELLTGTYQRELFRAPAPKAGIAEAFSRDKEAFARFLTLSGESPPAQQAMEAFLLYTGDADGALALHERAKAAGARWATDMELARIHIYRGRLEEAKAQLTVAIDALVSGGRIGAGERQEYIDYYWANGLREAKAYETLLAEQRVKAVPGAENLAGLHYDIACLEALLGRREAALAALGAAAAAGYADAGHLADDPDLAGLRADPAWAGIAAAVQANRASGRAGLKAQVLASMFEREAPAWTLRTVAGDSLSLADLRGQVLILDFWATWCGPCRMAMPVLDGWIDSEKPAGVRVFSVNVWEQTPAGAAAFMAREGYAMELLYGDEALAKAYGVEGIPYICAIDKAGKIRFEEKGYSPELGDKLALWAETLTKQ